MSIFPFLEINESPIKAEKIVALFSPCGAIDMSKVNLTTATLKIEQTKPDLVWDVRDFPANYHDSKSRQKEDHLTTNSGGVRLWKVVPHHRKGRRI